MKNKFVGLVITIAFLSCAGSTPKADTRPNRTLKVEMHLSAFGVESDNFPNIDALIDLSADSSYCKKWFYDPAHKTSVYRLTKKEMREVLQLVNSSAIHTLKKEYTIPSTDQPTSTMTVYSTTDTLQCKDYGLEGPSPLKELYKIVYKF
jgi:hypothetical protein